MNKVIIKIISYTYVTSFSEPKVDLQNKDSNYIEPGEK